MVIFVDSNVLIDLLAPDQRWFAWSREQLGFLGRDADLVANTVVLAELAANFVALNDLHASLAGLDVEILALDDEVAFAAGQAFRAYRRQHRHRAAILADFLIGGHAAHLGATLLTRDGAIYRAYFPDLALITPETHPHV